MNSLVDISVNLYFEITDSYMYGGKGTVGYMGIKLGGIKDINKLTDEFVEEKRIENADIFKVPIECVKLISKEEYDRETEEEED